LLITLSISYAMIERAELLKIKDRLKEPRRFIQVIMGPRQTGKTTLAGQVFDQSGIPGILVAADAVPAGNTAWIQEIWNSARLKMKSIESDEFLIIIDEIQKIADWSEIVKKLWDEDTITGTGIKVLILGSSRLILQRGLTDSLAGRFEITYLPHWSLQEMHSAFGWNAETYAWFGGYPGSATLIDDEERWKRYIRDALIEPSISKDILMLTRIDKPSLLKNIFELGSNWSGQILSFNKILGQLHDAGNTTTLSHYLKLLDTAGLLRGLEKYAANIIRKRSSSPKFQVHNNALLSTQLHYSFREMQTEPKLRGRIIESSIGSYLINRSLCDDFEVFYWRERNDEVDFIIEYRNRVVAVEVKSSYNNDKKGMDAFIKNFNPHRVYSIDNKSLSWQEFLTINPLDLF
jgi:uncharacterized protein